MASKRYNDNDKNAVGLMSKKLALISHFFLHFFAVPAQLRRETPKFDFLHRGSAQTKTNFPFPL